MATWTIQPTDVNYFRTFSLSSTGWVIDAFTPANNSGLDTLTLQVSNAERNTSGWMGVRLYEAVPTFFDPAAVSEVRLIVRRSASASVETTDDNISSEFAVNYSGANQGALYLFNYQGSAQIGTALITTADTTGWLSAFDNPQSWNPGNFIYHNYTLTFPGSRWSLAEWNAKTGAASFVDFGIAWLLGNTANMGSEAPFQYNIAQLTLEIDYTPLPKPAQPPDPPGGGLAILYEGLSDDFTRVYPEGFSIGSTSWFDAIITDTTREAVDFIANGEDFEIVDATGTQVASALANANWGEYGSQHWIPTGGDLRPWDSNLTVGEWYWIRPQGPSTPSGTGDLTASASISGSGRAIYRGSGALSASASLSGSGRRVSRGSGSISATVTLAGTGGLPLQVGSGEGHLSATASLSGTGQVVTPVFSGTGDVSATAALAGQGRRVSAGAGQPLAASVGLSGTGFRRGVQPPGGEPTYVDTSIWEPTVPPEAVPEVGDSTDYLLGTRFTVTEDGSISRIWWYKGDATDQGVQTLFLINATTQEVLGQASLDFGPVTGWLGLDLPTPVDVFADGTEYIAGYQCPATLNYVADSDYFVGGSLTVGPIVASIGTYRVGYTVAADLWTTFQQSSYFVDVDFTSEGGAGATISATVTLAGSGRIPSITASGEGHVSATAAMSGQGRRISRGTGQLDATVALDGTGLTVRRGSGSLSAAVVLAGDGAAVAPVFSGTGHLTAVVTLVGVGNAVGGEGTGTGHLTAVASLTGSGRSIRRGTGALTASVVLLGDGSTVAPVFSGSGALVAASTLFGQGFTRRQGSGALTALVALLGQGRNPLTVTAEIWNGTAWVGMDTYNGTDWVTAEVWNHVDEQWQPLGSA